MAKTLEKYQNLAEKLISANKLRDIMFKSLDNIIYCNWELPSGMKEIQYMRPVTSTDPHDAVGAGTRVLSTLDPLITFQSLAGDPDSKKKANGYERNLGWQLKNAEARRQGGVVRDIVNSALRYDEVCIRVIDLDYQIEQMDKQNINTTRLKAIRNEGRFLVNTYNPRNVYARYSSYGAEAVLIKETRSVDNVQDEWGDMASDLDDMNDEDREHDVVYYDYTDHKMRAVWIMPTGAAGSKEAVEIIPPMEHGLPFLDWVSIIGGTTLESRPEHKRHPLLYSVYRSGQWITQNIVKSLYVSEVIMRAGTKRDVVKTIDKDNPPEVNDGDPTSPIVLGMQDDYERVRPHEIDRALAEIDDRLAAGIDKSTVSRILQNAEVPSGAAFATLNLATQTALGALKPYKDLAEKALAQVLRLMLLWVHYTDEPLLAFESNQQGAYGEQYLISPDEIQPDAIYIEVELKPDVPTDRQQRANTAMMLVQMGYPKEYAFGDLGITDPNAAIEQSYFERMQEHDFTMWQQQEMAQMQMQMQEQQAQAQQAAQMQQQAEMQNMAQQQQMMGGTQGGQPFDPAAGGQPPAMANPELTREIASGQDRAGNEMPEMGGL